jgi:hypothetical protein
MTPKQVEELKNKGIDPEILGKHITLMYMLSDMAESYTVSVHSMLQELPRNNHDRLTIEKIKRLSKELTGSAAKGMGTEKVQVSFGNRVDFLRDLIEVALYIDSEDDRLKAVSTLKIIAKTK